jgi:hypothetical protein
VPATFAAVFEELGRSGYLSEELAASLVSLARFRNLLEHGYADVDDDRVVEILTGHHLRDPSPANSCSRPSSSHRWRTACHGADHRRLVDLHVVEVDIAAFGVGLYCLRCPPRSYSRRQR